MNGAAQEARQQLQAGRPAEAEQILRRALILAPADAELRTMLAQLLASVARKEEAIEELQRALEFAPDARPPRLLLARLANELGRAALAEQHARRLTAQDPRDSEAWSALGVAAFGLGHGNAAREALQRAVTQSPDYAAARNNLASVLCNQERSEEALAETDEAARRGVRNRTLMQVRARALIQLDRGDEAEPVLVELLAANPADTESHRILVQLRQVRGDDDPLRDLRAAALQSAAVPAVRLAFGDALLRCGDAAAAEVQLRALIVEFGPTPSLLSSLALIYQQSGRMAEAHVQAREAFSRAPTDLGIAETFVATAIAAGAPADALPVVERLRISHPRDQRWITYRIDIARLRGELEFGAWFDPRVVTGTYDLPAPAGFRDLGEFHAALASTLGARHRQKNHPLDQSLRHGTQTSRNLLVRPTPEVAQLFALFTEAMSDYLYETTALLAGAGAAGDTHPLLARNHSPAALVGCWSVRLQRRGFHVNHIHPEGWLSSAYYVSVPAEVADSEALAGWLKFGEPRFPVAGLGPSGFLQPVPGRLVLFPSYLWHGTNPLSGDEPRISIAFDALPQAEIL